MRKTTIVGLLLASLLAGCGGSHTSQPTTRPNTSGGGDDLSCDYEQETITDLGYQGVGVTYTSNVRVSLHNSAGRVIAPNTTETGTTETGIGYNTSIYVERDLGAGRYSVAVSTISGRLLETYSVTLRAGESKLLTIFCR